jgi:hypothetical protein
MRGFSDVRWRQARKRRSGMSEEAREAREATEALLQALKNQRVLLKKPFMGGGLPGPEPVVPIPARTLLVDREAGVFYIGFDELIGLVRGVLASA